VKHKKIDWSKVPWTPFEEATVLGAQDGVTNDLVDELHGEVATYWRNSRYQVAMRKYTQDGVLALVHLSFHVLDRQPHHDWRDMQRIKNELVGPEVEAVELFPAESRLVDTSNEYHLWAFPTSGRMPFGMAHRALSYGSWRKSRQREWPPGERPADARSPEQVEADLQQAIANYNARKSGGEK
jgi:hypothetical protein